MSHLGDDHWLLAATTGATAAPWNPNEQPDIGVAQDVGPERIAHADPDESEYVLKQQRWLLFLRHCAKCRGAEGTCPLRTQCGFGKQLWAHILACQLVECEYPRCSSTRRLLVHHQRCQAADCPICVPVREQVRRARQQDQQQQQGAPAAQRQRLAAGDAGAQARVGVQPVVLPGGGHVGQPAAGVDADYFAPPATPDHSEARHQA